MAAIRGRLLGDVVVAEVGDRLSTAYCGRLLADLGATVLRIAEGVGRAGACRPSADYAAYLHGGKQSVSQLSRLSTVDAVICDSGPAAVRARSALVDSRELVTVMMTDFGTTGPNAHTPASELTLQAESGIVALQRTEDRPPVMVGVPLSELTCGINGAIGVVHALLSRDAGGGAIDVDVSRFESLVGIQQYPWLYPQIDGHMIYSPPDPTPGIEKAADGHVCIIALLPDQWTALKKMVGIAELDDPRYDDGAIRGRHRSEVSRLLRTFTSKRTVAELVDLGAQYRVPITPVATATTGAALEPYATRGTYVHNGYRNIVQPRPPYRIDGSTAEPAAPPQPSQHNDSTTAHATTAGRPLTAQSTAQFPLGGLRLVEFGVFQAGPLVAANLAYLGADIIKVEAIRRPDLVRFTAGLTRPLSRPWERAAAFFAPNLGKRAITADLSTPDGLAVVTELIRRSDIVLENYAPRTLDRIGLSYSGIHDLRENAIVLRMPAWGLDGPWQDRPGFTFTANAMSGMAELTGYPDSDPLVSGTIIDPIAAQFGTLVALAAIYRRGRTGTGADIELALSDVAVQLTGQAIIEASKNSPPTRSGNQSAEAIWQDTVQCADGQWVAISLRSASDIEALTRAHPPSNEPADAERLENLRAELGRMAKTSTASALVDSLRARGIAAAAVVSGVDLTSHPQLIARQRLFDVSHPVVGTLTCIASAARISSAPQAHSPLPTPLFGQHNSEVLTELGYSAAEQADLAAANAIGDSPYGMPLPPLGDSHHDETGLGLT
jgi:crotonobetainyl-CoA:carnitine CoA-transferase CaiB-like acyl-CoA transferase